ncbi:MAG: diguanylate cyclase/phosphodiesterase (GGDEF & EAL domains) with PAS/PAC sensor(s) [uncultured Sulfurovum sp.]|uniref:Diguanylate cyclase/phosphodiesterase (GGDEF & EAL domains) with PAS/PAC sensor(S) n=1 Tax=uncultured Sulfurovum sp. TaxID=269237 RepID=A0A6S6S8P4_9BACT|nr:MAG: diguanylate cyclase/phosphodiesterase (GGDEF & EAL domains) with PAS/PAC sensor(s) [uncultured Sulfurovum sp.]
MINDFSILYIEDDRLTQKIIVNILGTHFSNIFVASDGLEGIKLYHEKQPDIVLSDISMPKMNGIEMTQVIKKYNPQQKIALFTSYNDIEYLNKAINMGVDKYILKPFKATQMFSALDELVERLKQEKEDESYKEELEFVSQHDELTGLFNRRQFFAMYDNLRYRSDRENKIVGILAIDLNKFKAINDTYGHEAGDLVLKRVAKNLLKSTRKEDLVARLGGDEFLIAIGFLQDNAQILNFLERIVENFKEPLLYVDDDRIEHSISISCSIGVSFHSSSDYLFDLEGLMRQADRAMYTAKKLQKPYSFFDEKEASKFKIKAEKSKAIKEGIDKGEFRLYYQPIIDIKSGQTVSFESLIRWEHPLKGTIMPDKFLPYVLDEMEIITHLGKWVLEEVFIQYETWFKAGHAMPLSINISFNELASADFIVMIKALLDKYPLVKTEQIIFEVFENIALQDIELEQNALDEVKVLGFKIALDNFGTGLSTLSSIKRFNIDSIKIDKSFVMNMLTDKEDHSLVNASIQLAKAFGYVVIAQGVESEAHLPILLKLGCNQAQGFGIGRPKPANEIFV